MINLIISSVYATSFELKDARGHGIITLEREWTLLKETLGIPFLFVSKGDNPNSSIGITFTGIKNAALNPKSLKTTQDKYRIGRKKWGPRPWSLRTGSSRRPTWHGAPWWELNHAVNA